MDAWIENLGRLVNAEDYFHFFEVPFDPRVVSVNRLHILKKFGEFRESIEAEWPEDGPSDQKKEAYRRALVAAYETFLTRTAQDEKLFKVFRDQASGGINVEFHPEGIGNKP